LKHKIEEIFSLLEREDYLNALSCCEGVVSGFMTSFMEELTVNTATDYVGSVILFSQICATIKKPWMAFPKLQAASGALRFLRDYMADSKTLADTNLSFAEAYSYGGFLPEAVSCYLEASKLYDDLEKSEDSLASAFFYEARFGKKLVADFSFFENKLGKKRVSEIKLAAADEAAAQIVTDPIEAEKAFLDNRFEVEKITDELISQNEKEGIPFFELYWNTKKSVLKDRFDLDWHTPAEMNPNIRFY